jgi:predicted alpha-1,6-mannanase (GH76 family)
VVIDMVWATRAGAAEQSLRARHFRALWALPGYRLATRRWPAGLTDRLFVGYVYWWQAHLLDCLIDAQLRSPNAGRARDIQAVVRAQRLRNGGRWLNRYYDDIAWFGLACERAQRLLGVGSADAVPTIVRRLGDGWTGDGGGGIWWRSRDDFKNAPANGPAAILLARNGNLAFATAIAEWLERTLVDRETGLVWDGVYVDDGRLVKIIYSYCQGVFLGACLELMGEDTVWRARAERTVAAVARSETVAGQVLSGGGGGDGGLFKGILARYLAQAALRLDGTASADAAAIVHASAESAWRHAVDAPGGPLFGPKWTADAALPLPAKNIPERDLSVQCGAWMLMEAAALLERHKI